jgi:hypothetical protein
MPYFGFYEQGRLGATYRLITATGRTYIADFAVGGIKKNGNACLNYWLTNPILNG